MKKLFFIYSLTLALIAGIIYSCKKQENITSNPISAKQQATATNQNGNSYKNGEGEPPIVVVHPGGGIPYSTTFLRFESDEVYRETLNSLQFSLYTSKEDEYLDRWEAQFKQFNSMRTVFNIFTENFNSDVPQPFKQYETTYIRLGSDGECECTMPVQYDLATLLNPDGIMQIGNEIIQITYDKVKVIEDGDERKIPRMKETEVSLPDERIFVTKVIREGRNTCTNILSKGKRVAGATTRTTHTKPSGAVVYSALEYWVKYEEKNFWGCWKQRKATYLKVEAEWGDIGNAVTATLIKAAGSYNSSFIPNISIKVFKPAPPCYDGIKVLAIPGTKCISRGRFWKAEWGLTDQHYCDDGICF